MELAELRFAHSCGTAFDDTGDDASDGVALYLHPLYQRLHCCGFLWIRTAHGVRFRQREVIAVIVTIQCDIAHL